MTIRDTLQQFADGWTKRMGGPSSWAYEDWLEDGWVVHSPVGTFSANGFGLHDTIGNVWEWCRDGYGGYDTDVNPGDGLWKVTDTQNRMLRGGSFNNAAEEARSASRYRGPPRVSGHNLGVRPAKAITE